MPLEFAMALHQATRSPDLVMEIIRGTEARKKDSKEPVFTPASDTDEVEYFKPTLVVGLLELTESMKVKITVPENTTVRPDNIYIKGSNGRMQAISEGQELTANEVNNAYFMYNGQYIRINPGGMSGGRYNSSTIQRKNQSSVPNSEFAEKFAESLGYDGIGLDGGDLVYNFIDIYFEKLANGKYKAKNLAGQTIETKADNLVDKLGLYDLFDDVMKESGKNISEILKSLKDLLEDYEVKTYQPMLWRTYSHWFRDVYWHMDPEDDVEDGKKTEGKYYVETDKDYYLLTGESWTKYNLTKEQGKEVRNPILNKAEQIWQAYDVKYKEEEGQGKLQYLDAKELGPDFKGFDKLFNIIAMYKKQSAEIEQIDEGRRGPTNPRVKNLFTDVKWYKYDGDKGRADKNNEERGRTSGEGLPLDQESDLKTLVSPSEDMLASMEELEGSKSLDAQFILRDLKEFYVELRILQKGRFKKSSKKSIEMAYTRI